jgi:hypothetical protein
MRKRLVLSLLAVVFASAATLAEAQGNTPVGRWNLAAYNDATPNMNLMANHTICFVATGPGVGTWVGSFPGWNGRWFQKGLNVAGHGDRVRLVGGYANGAGNDAAELDFNNINNMTGPWSEWRDNFAFLAWAKVVLTRINQSCTTPLTEGALPDAVIDDGTNPAERSTAPAPTCELPPNAK